MSKKDNFSELSIHLTKKLDNKIKKQNGIFFTPLSIIKKNLKLLEDFTFNNVLEPSCGSCEYITQLYNKYNNEITITGIEYNKTIFNEIKSLNYNIINENFLLWDNKDNKYDLIIGNPPYFVMKKNDVNSEYYNFFDGRPNIFILFIIKSLKLIEKNGIISFILPSNFLNCLYYDKLRTYINENYKIITIENCVDDNYLTTFQDTIIFIIQNKNEINNNKLYSLKINNYTIFNTKENISILKKLYENSTTLSTLDCKINIGNIVWNQNKNILDNNKKYTRLIYNSDIKDNKLITKKYKNDSKKNYIKKKGFNKKCIILNRGYGTGNYTFDYCLLSLDYEYLLENHIISISHEDDGILSLIIKSFENPYTKQFIKLYFHNNAINITELKYIFPIYKN